MSQFGGKVNIEEVLSYKVAPAWNEEKVQGEERAWGEESSKGKECVSKKGRGEKQAGEEQLVKDKGQGRVDKEQVAEHLPDNEQKQSQEQF